MILTSKIDCGLDDSSYQTKNVLRRNKRFIVVMLLGS